MIDTRLRQIVDCIPEDMVWHKSSNRGTFISVARGLHNNGLTFDEIEDTLAALYIATANEFGVVEL